MKVKEAFSNDFKKDEDLIYLGRKQIELKKKNGLVLLEQKYVRDNLQFSNYLLHDLVYNGTYVYISIPDPLENDLYKTIFLKYQNGVKRFLMDFFDVLVGEKEDIETIYSTKNEKDLDIEIDSVGKVSTVLIMVGDESEKYFGIISWFGENQEDGTKFAENFVNLFEGQPVKYSWKELADLINSRRDQRLVNDFIGELDDKNDEG